MVVVQNNNISLGDMATGFLLGLLMCGIVALSHIGSCDTIYHYSISHHKNKSPQLSHTHSCKTKHGAHVINPQTRVSHTLSWETKLPLQGSLKYGRDTIKSDHSTPLGLCHHIKADI